MSNEDRNVDPWLKEELLAIRHVGTLCGAAIVLLVFLSKNAAELQFTSPALKTAVGFLFFGVFGSGMYQLITIQNKGEVGEGWNKIWMFISAIFVIVGLFGFVLLGMIATHVI